jgi:AraC-like DNA-binding protein
MQLASLEELSRDPVGKFVGGARFMHFCAAPRLWGIVLWERPTEADALEIYRSLPFEMRAPAVPHAAMIDASRMEGGEPAAFARVERFLVKFAAPLGDWILRLAMVRPSGLAGAMVAGAPQLLQFPFPVSVFEDVPAALRWLAPVAELTVPVETLAASVSEAQAQASGTPALLRQVRLWLEANLRGPTLADAAGAVAMSERSLQRRLSEAGTTFQDELGQARVRVAQRMLAAGPAQLTEVAICVGCASLQHFSALFKRVTGESPGAWRKGRAPR